MKPNNKNIFKSDDFIDFTQKHIGSLLRLLISGGTEFAVITKPKNIKMTPDLNIFSKPDEYVKFDLIGYSFETSQVTEDRFIFRAGFGTGHNINESEVSMDLSHIFQIVSTGTKVKPIFMNFSEPADKKKIDRSKMFLSKNKNLGKSQ